MSDTSAGTQVLERPDTFSASETGSDKPWSVIVLDDSVNQIVYVRQVFQMIFGYSKEKAHDLTMQVHNTGRADVWQGPRGEAEVFLSQLHAEGLTAKLEKLP